MKRFVALVLILATVLSMVACGNQNQDQSRNQDEKEEINCASCGEEISKEAAFCEHCGAAVKDNQSDSDNGRFVGLYRYSAYDYIFIPADVDGGAIQLICKKFYELNSDGTGRIYHEVESVYRDYEVSEEQKQEALESRKTSVTWREDDGYLIICYSGGGVTTFEKKGAHFIDITNEINTIIKIS